MKSNNGTAADKSILDYMLALNECASISEAAARCGIGQSALSNALKHLETQLETRLYDRKAGAMTAEGAVYVAYARKVLRICDECREALNAMTEGSFALGLDSCLGNSVAEELKERISPLSPRLRFSVISAERETLARRVREGTLDMYCAFEREEVLPGQITRSAAPIPLYLAIPARNYTPGADLQAILRSNVLLLQRSPVLMECVEQFFRRADLRPDRVSETNSYDMARILMEQADAVCVAPAVLCPDFGNTCFLRLSGAEVTPKFVYPADSPASQIREEIILAFPEISARCQGV